MRFRGKHGKRRLKTCLSAPSPAVQLGKSRNDAPPDIVRCNRSTNKLRSSFKDFERAQDMRITIGQELQRAGSSIVPRLRAVSPAFLTNTVPQQGTGNMPGGSKTIP